MKNTPHARIKRIILDEINQIVNEADPLAAGSRVGSGLRHAGAADKKSEDKGSSSGEAKLARGKGDWRSSKRSHGKTKHARYGAAGGAGAEAAKKGAEEIEGWKFTFHEGIVNDKEMVEGILDEWKKDPKGGPDSPEYGDIPDEPDIPDSSGEEGGEGEGEGGGGSGRVTAETPAGETIEVEASDAKWILKFKGLWESYLPKYEEAAGRVEKEIEDRHGWIKEAVQLAKAGGKPEPEGEPKPGEPAAAPEEAGKDAPTDPGDVPGVVESKKNIIKQIVLSEARRIMQEWKKDPKGGPDTPEYGDIPDEPDIPDCPEGQDWKNGKCVPKDYTPEEAQAELDRQHKEREGEPGEPGGEPIEVGDEDIVSSEDAEGGDVPWGMTDEKRAEIKKNPAVVDKYRKVWLDEIKLLKQFKTRHAEKDLSGRVFLLVFPGEINSKLLPQWGGERMAEDEYFDIKRSFKNLGRRNTVRKAYVSSIDPTLLNADSFPTLGGVSRTAGEEEEDTRTDVEKYRDWIASYYTYVEESPLPPEPPTPPTPPVDGGGEGGGGDALAIANAFAMLGGPAMPGGGPINFTEMIALFQALILGSHIKGEGGDVTQIVDVDLAQMAEQNAELKTDLKQSQLALAKLEGRVEEINKDRGSPVAIAIAGGGEGGEANAAAAAEAMTKVEIEARFAGSFITFLMNNPHLIENPAKALVIFLKIAELDPDKQAGVIEKNPINPAAEKRFRGKVVLVKMDDDNIKYVTAQTTSKKKFEPVEKAAAAAQKQTVVGGDPGEPDSNRSDLGKITWDNYESGDIFKAFGLEKPLGDKAIDRKRIPGKPASVSKEKMDKTTGKGKDPYYTIDGSIISDAEKIVGKEPRVLDRFKKFIQAVLRAFVKDDKKRDAQKTRKALNRHMRDANLNKEQEIGLLKLLARYGLIKAGEEEGEEVKEARIRNMKARLLSNKNTRRVLEEHARKRKNGSQN